MEVAELQAEIEGIKENKKVLAEVQKDRQEKLNIPKGMSSWSKMGPRKLWRTVAPVDEWSLSLSLAGRLVPQ